MSKDAGKHPFPGQDQSDPIQDSGSNQDFWAISAPASASSADGSSATPGASSSGNPSGGSTLTIGSGHGVIFNDSFDSSCTQAYINCVVAAQETYRKLFSNNITLSFSFTEVNSGASGDLATNSWYWSSNSPVSYTTLKNALISLAASEPNNQYLKAAVASLPASDPTGGLGFHLPSAYAQVLGLTSSSSTDTVTLNSGYNFSFGQDVINTLEHEMSEGGMGRVGGLDDQNSAWSTMDLFRYNSSGAADYTDGRDYDTTYFSYNGGATLSSLTYNNEYSGSTKENSGDTADFNQQDVYGTGDPGETNYLSQTDLEVMEVLGWKRAPVEGDFTDNGNSDIFWQNTSSGAIGEWLTNSTGQIYTAPALGNAPGYNIVGAGDFTGNGTSDIFWQQANGNIGEWQMTNGQISAAPLLGNASPSFNIAAIGDFTGNGIDDIFWQNNSTGAIGEWLMNSSGQIASAPALGSASTSLSIIGAGDFNDDGVSDILWEQSNGTVGEWLLNSSGQIYSAPSLGSTPSGFQLIGIGDFTGTGTDDVVWRSGNTVGEWMMSNGLISQSITLGNVSATWQFSGVGNFTGNGVDDMLWRDTSTGALSEWQMVDGQIVHAPGLGTVASNLAIIARK